MHLPNASLFIAFWSFYEYNNEAFGAVAHLGERVVRNDEVAGSIPVCSTIDKAFVVAQTQPLGRVQKPPP